jgi:hypothetical protein
MGTSIKNGMLKIKIKIKVNEDKLLCKKGVYFITFGEGNYLIGSSDISIKIGLNVDNIL